MINEKKVVLRRPTCVTRKWLTESQVSEIKQMLYRVLKTFLNNTEKGTRFCLFDLIGKEGRDFKDSPFESIYNSYCAYNAQTAYSNTAKDLGWFLKDVLQNDEHTYNSSYFIRVRNGKKVRIKSYYVCD